MPVVPCHIHEARSVPGVPQYRARHGRSCVRHVQGVVVALYVQGIGEYNNDAEAAHEEAREVMNKPMFHRFGTAFRNVAIEEYIYARMAKDIDRFDFEFMEFLRGFYAQNPQINERTQIQFVYEGSRIAIAEWEDQHPAFPKPIYVPAPGLKAAAQRLRGRIHTWFVTHEKHPGEPKPIYVTHIGMKQVYPDAPMTGLHQRTLELKRWSMTFGADHFYGGGERYRAQLFSIVCAYDGMRDILYIRDA